ncbi:MAG: ABC transporter permease, partial [Bacteroidota bacterium]
MTPFLIRDFLRSKGLLLGLVALFMTGLVSLHIGKLFLEQQAEIVVQTADFQAEHISRHVEYIEDDLGLLLYYIRFGFVNEVPALTGLSIGHRDIRPNVLSVNIRNLEEQ